MKNNSTSIFSDKLFETRQLFFNVILFCLPLFSVIWISGLWICFIAIVLLYVVNFRKNNYFSELKIYYHGYYKYVLISFIYYFIFSLISIIFFKSPLKSIDNSWVFLLWLLISPIIAKLRPNNEILGYGCFVAVLVAFGLAVVQFHYFNVDRPYGFYGISVVGSGAIKFGDIALLLGILSYILLAHSRFFLLGILAIGFGFSVCLYAGARGGLLAAIFCTIIWFFIKTEKISKQKYLTAILIITVFFCFLSISIGQHILERITTTLTDLALIKHNNLGASMGVRLQLWQAASVMFLSHPILGVGLNNFDNALFILYKQHLVSKSLITFSHAHNEYLCAIATGGLIGFSITLALLLTPLAFFKKYYGKNVWVSTGFWGISFLAFCALTDCIFDRRMTVMLFVIIISICMAGHSLINQSDKSCTISE